MKKVSPFVQPPGTMPVRPVPTVSGRDPNFYEDGSGEAARGEPVEPMDQPCDRGMPSPRSTTSGMPFKLEK